MSATEANVVPPTPEYSMKLQTICLMAVQMYLARPISPEQAVGQAIKIYAAVELQLQ